MAESEQHGILPSPDEQRQIVQTLSPASGGYSYRVSKAWYQKFNDYIGRNKTCTAHPASFPGPLEMDLESADNNINLDESLWKKLVAWYGVSSTHQLNRLMAGEMPGKKIEICVLSPFNQMVTNPVKLLALKEEMGYIELQLKRVFAVPDHLKTRLWISNKTRNTQFSLILDRKSNLRAQLNRSKDPDDYILALEVATADGTWPTHVPGKPFPPSFQEYDEVIRLAGKTWHQELIRIREDVVDSIYPELRKAGHRQITLMRKFINGTETDIAKLRKDFNVTLSELEKLNLVLEDKMHSWCRHAMNMSIQAQELKREKHLQHINGTED